MKINDKSYILPETNFIRLETIKKCIVLGNTFSSDMKHFNGWITRHNGLYNKTAAFTIDINGVVYRHFDPIYMSTIMGNVENDKKSIVILLENRGWLVKNEENGEFIDWVGNIYNKPELVVEKKWRNYLYWEPYNQKQFNSTLKLVNQLCDEFSIPKYAIPHNIKLDDLDFNGVLYKSNFEKYFTDLSPAWNSETFKYKLENA